MTTPTDPARSPSETAETPEPFAWIVVTPDGRPYQSFQGEESARESAERFTRNARIGEWSVVPVFYSPASSASTPSAPAAASEPTCPTCSRRLTECVTDSDPEELPEATCGVVFATIGGIDVRCEAKPGHFGFAHHAAIGPFDGRAVTLTTPINPDEPECNDGADVKSAHTHLLDLVLSRKFSAHSLQTAIRSLIGAAKREAFTDMAMGQMRLLEYRLTGNDRRPTPPSGEIAAIEGRLNGNLALYAEWQEADMRALIRLARSAYLSDSAKDCGTVASDD